MISFKKIIKISGELCELYQRDSFVCNQEAGPYCGKWRELINRE
jgi:hypothetical protein